ncbi:MAG: Ig-like domain-containing protein [Eubacterium sp.]|nr:Ig-like domain-containing protein [Eubacterium sp.]MDD7210663.1 Ig-like domain-containing protein [Lachnospiraceae bacterium]MDY5497712.1 Ig-like domain-containing protein [Anaerobutyricum sp.]
MKKIKTLIAVLLVLVLAVPAGVNAAAYDDDDYYDSYDDPWDYDDTWEEEPDPDMSGVTLTPISSTVFYEGDEYTQAAYTMKVRINSPAYVFNDFSYIESVDSTNNSFYCDVEDVKNNILTLSIEPYYYMGEAASTNIYITINEKKFPAIPVTVQRISLNKSSLLLSKGKTAKLSVRCGGKAFSGKTEWCSLNKKIVSISNTGKIKAKKEGNAVVYAKVNGHRVGCAVSVTSKKKCAAINTAKKIVKTGKYSQKKRMQKKYYDCSSLVWKAYRKNGCNFGNKNWAPTAAEQAKYMTKKHKMLGKISWKKVDKMYYRAGDVCYKVGEPNGRYKNVYHAEMVAGYDFCYFDQKGKPVVTLLPVRGSFYGDKHLMARP